MAPKLYSSGSNCSDKDLDQELRPRNQSKTPSPTTGIITHPENLMDNWLLSSRELASQKDSDNRQLRNAWDARNRLPVDRSTGGSFNGAWKYDFEETSKIWQPRYSIRSLAKSTESIPAFPAHKGDEKISQYYRDLWVKNDKAGFLKAIYKQFAVKDIIPEKKVWKIFRCLISELVPDKDKWKTAPPNIVAEPNTIWQVGKCMLYIVTKGRFWDDRLNVLNPKDKDEPFGKFKQNTLQKSYSKSLMKYILWCLTAVEADRPSREQLMSHFEEVFSVYTGTHKPTVIDDSGDTPYSPKDSRIPKGLTKKEGQVYEKLIEIMEARQNSGTGVKTPHIITITDLAKDYDDLMAMMCLKELHRLGIVHLEGFVANLMPADRRALFGRGALDSLGLHETPCAVGTKGDQNRVLKENSHEFDGTKDFMPKESTISRLPEGQQLMEQVFTKAVNEDYKVTLLGISSLMDIALFAKTHEELLVKGLQNVVLQGGYRVIDNVLVPDSAAANNKFDMDGAKEFHAFLQNHKIESTAWTKIATEAVSIYNSLFVALEKTKHPLGPYIRRVQVSQDLNFYKHACEGPLFAPHMTQDWYVNTKSTWFAAGHEPDEPYPLGQDMVPYFTKVVAYDALAAVGAAGEDVLKAFDLIKPYTTRPDAEHPTHRLIGVPAIRKEGDQPAMPQDKNLDGDMMGVMITALMKGSILATQQGLKLPASS